MIITSLYISRSSSHFSQCKTRILPPEQIASHWCKNRSSKGRMTPSVNNSFREVLQDLLQPHVVFCYLQAIEHNSAEGEKAGCGHGHHLYCWNLDVCVLSLGAGFSSTCNTNACGFCWHGLKLKKNIVVQRSKWKLLWQELRLYPNKPLIWKLFGILVNTVNLV